MNTHPPAWAQSLLSLLVSERTRDSVVGDLLEEYTESIAPLRGEAAANRWYLRQVAGFLWRASLPWAIVAGLILGVRDAIDATIATTDNFHFRAAVTTYLAFATYASAGVSAGWRSGRAAAGLVVSLVMTATAMAIGVAAALIVSALISVSAFPAAPSYLTLDEHLDVPVLPMLIAGAALATIGAAIGRLFTGSSGSRASLRT